MYIIELFPEIMKMIELLPVEEQGNAVRDLEMTFDQELQNEINQEILNSLKFQDTK